MEMIKTQVGVKKFGVAMCMLAENYSQVKTMMPMLEPRLEKIMPIS